MKITLSQDAVEWVTRELHRSPDEAIRFFVRYGDSTIHPGFRLALTVAKPVDPALTWTEQGVPFFIEQSDIWYLEGYHLDVHYDTTHDDLQFSFTKLQSDPRK